MFCSFKTVAYTHENISLIKASQIKSAGVGYLTKSQSALCWDQHIWTLPCTTALLKYVYCYILNRIKCSLATRAKKKKKSIRHTVAFLELHRFLVVVYAQFLLCICITVLIFYPLDWHFFKDPCVHTLLYFKMAFHMTVLLEPNKHSLSNTSNNTVVLTLLVVLTISFSIWDDCSLWDYLQLVTWK